MSESHVGEESAPSGSDAGSLLNLKESMFKPEFTVPNYAKRKENLLLSALVGLFEDLSKAVENLSEDYHEEYIFKHYLQEKWNETLKSIGQGEDDTPPAAATATV